MALSKGGSDWQDILIMDMATKKNLSDKLEWVKVSGISWQGKGFYYSRYPKPEGSALAAKNENHQVFFHKVGTSQEVDELVFEDKVNPQRFNGVYATEDEKFAFLSISDRGKGKDGNALYYRALGQKEFKPIVSEITDFSFSIIDNVGQAFLIQTNKDAPNDKVEKYDIATGKWSSILPEKPEPLQGVGTAGGKMFATYLKDVTTRAYVYDLKGKLENEVQLPSLGSAGGFGGQPIQFVIQAPDFEALKNVLPKFVDEANKTGVFQGLDANLKFNKPELRLEIDRERARKLNVSIRDIAETLQLYYAGQRYGYFIKDSKQYEVIGEADRIYRDDPRDLSSLYVRNKAQDLFQGEFRNRGQ
jgi:hypothetical protein